MARSPKSPFPCNDRLGLYMGIAIGSSFFAAISLMLMGTKPWNGYRIMQLCLAFAVKHPVVRYSQVFGAWKAFCLSDMEMLRRSMENDMLVEWTTSPDKPLSSWGCRTKRRRVNQEEQTQQRDPVPSRTLHSSSSQEAPDSDRDLAWTRGHWHLGLVSTWL